MTRQVKIGPKFFEKAKNDYANWVFAWVREIVQNSTDARGCSRIDFNIALQEDGNTKVIVKNNGEPMDENILVNKLLALGESGKDFEGTVGGFGLAKNILLFTHLHWEVNTGDLRVVGCGGEYSLEYGPYWFGTETTVIMEGDLVYDLERKLREFCRYAQWDGSIYLGDEHLETNQYKGSPRRDLGFGVVYTNKSDSNRLVVRIGGIPMFINYVGLDRLVIVELKGKSSVCLTSNRDGLRSPFCHDLSNFITELSVDKKSALKARNPKYRHYHGTRLCHEKSRTNVSEMLGLNDSDEDYGVSPLQSVVAALTSGVRLNAPSFVKSESTSVQVSIGEEFVIKNETDLVIPSYYLPDSGEFSSYSKKLVKIWGRLMLQMHRTFDAAADFAIGFIFPEDKTLAEWEEGNFGTVYYLAPAKLVTQKYSSSQSWRKVWKLTDRNQLLCTAAHEFVHGLGFRCHDEAFAGKYTETMGRVLDKKSDFTWCFK